MPLSPEKIKELLALPKRGRPKNQDYSTRDYKTWFELGHKVVDESTGELATCDNPECHDPRALGSSQEKKGIVIVNIHGRNCCRICFLEGWLLDPTESQMELT